ncbi:glutamyl-tRNA reductase [Roseivirga ehrenbergii]|uniref:Glutamyl-tRNA reductase n=1 Tax=Roseivirga ehrenbergii (strain DSM 102268 / JCM 13514 / KCTC 12282 / NCIMB 14502 / KMM 6017) TaxID=279360 RepID=A0A150WXS1_ROSEK|nr:glutamyl-tRNA reductase [Roseivirga ehrenbergii]KYG71285.1 glutamyl-tRNA reductase [Roseivirga ehrenbergii]TCK99675.1 glutamyl-tRNA reductase [Roseivirga ehrenbergii]
MQGKFRAISLSYKKAPVEIREIISIDELTIKSILSEVSEVLSLTEALILSTCNRTEVYYSAEQNLDLEIIKLIAIKKGILNADAYINYFNSFESEEAVNHLFRVSLGLEAQVVGDLQISNQVKRAYQWAADAQLAGPFLHRLMHTIFFSSKRVVQETSFRDGAASVSYAAAELVQNLASTIIEPKVLILGIGEIGADVCRHLSETDLTVAICNRTTEKAEALALECNQAVIPFSELKEAIAEYDLIISSVAHSTPIINKELAGEINNGFKFFVDLSIPRSISPEVGKLSGVTLFNIDEINDKASAAVEKRKSSIPLVEAIIEEAIAEFNDWSKEMVVSPTIHKLKNALEQIRQDEITRHLKNASPEVQEFAERFSKSITQKIIKLPVLQLKAACKRGDAESLIDVLNELFDLENTPKEK